MYAISNKYVKLMSKILNSWDIDQPLYEMNWFEDVKPIQALSTHSLVTSTLCPSKCSTQCWQP